MRGDIDALKAFDEELAKGQIQIMDGVGNATSHVSLPGRMTHQLLSHELHFQESGGTAEAALRIRHSTTFASR